MKKKLFVIGSSVIGLVAIVFVLALILTSIKYKKTITIQQEDSNQQKVTTNNSQEQCPFSNDQDAYEGALLSKEIQKCNCVKNIDLKTSCNDTVNDLVYRDNAVKQLNITLCDNIKNGDRKDACINVVESKTEYLKKEDPQLLMNLLAGNHDEKSVAIMEEMIKNNQNDIDGRIQLAMSYADIALKKEEQGDESGKKIFLNKALAIIDKIKADQESNSNLYRAEGYIYEIKPDISKSIMLYTKAIELDNKNIEAYAGRGHANRILGALDIAINDFETAAGLDNKHNNMFIYTNLCNLYYFKGETEKAINSCEEVLSSDDNVDPTLLSETYQVLGNIFINKEQYNKANQYLMQAKLLTPKDANLYVTYAKLNIAQKNYSEAQNNARKATDINPQKAYGYLMLSQALAYQDKCNDATNIAQKGISLVDTDVSLLSSNKDYVVQKLNAVTSSCQKQ